MHLHVSRTIRVRRLGGSQPLDLDCSGLLNKANAEVPLVHTACIQIHRDLLSPEVEVSGW